MKSVSVVALLFVACVAEAQQTFTVHGTVRGPDGPVSQATIAVQVGGQSIAQTVSDGNGSFQIQAPAGEITVDTSKAGSSLTRDRFGITLDRDTEVRIRLERQIRITGRVTRPGGLSVAADVEVRSLRSGYSASAEAPAGFFSLDVPAVPVAIHAIPRDPLLGPSRLNIDLSSRTSADMAIPVSENGPPVMPSAPPTASRISISATDDDGVARVRGSADAVESLSSVFVANLQTHQVSFGVSASDGSFDLPIFAPPGSHILVKHDPTGRYLAIRGSRFGSFTDGPPGTIIQVPAAAVSSGVPASYLKRLDTNLPNDPLEYPYAGVPDAAQLWLSGSMEKPAYQVGETVVLRGRLSIFSRDFNDSTDPSKMRIEVSYLHVRRLFDGDRYIPEGEFITARKTPGGLPIEMVAFSPGIARWSHTPLRRGAAHRLDAEWTLEFDVERGSGPGIYMPQWYPIVTGMPERSRHFEAFPTFQGTFSVAGLPQFVVSDPDPPRLPWILGFDEIVNGTRGTLAREDRDRFGYSNHVKTTTDTFVIPPRDERTGAPIRYRLEPFVPITFSTGRLPEQFEIPLKFPSGSLTVQVTRPDGVVEDLGSAPFQQVAIRAPLSRSGLPISGLTAHIADFCQLTTLDSRFDYSFGTTGAYVVRMTGEVEDVNGNVFRGGGSYEVTVARLLDIETAVIPGTPFHVGDRASLSVVVQPPVPADVQVRIRSFPNSDPARVIEREVHGNANRFGFFAPAGTFPFTAAGEYQADVTARYVDQQGVLWAGATTWGNVVETPSSRLIARGRRGYDCVEAIQERWFEALPPRGCGHVMVPFDGGDVVWLRDTNPHGPAAIPIITVQDPDGAFADRVRRSSGPRAGPLFEARVTAGEIPLLSYSDPKATPYTPYEPEDLAYFYAFVERPGVHVREFIADDRTAGDGYWRFDDNYQFQLGNGANGDLVNDFKFQFGGAVYRAPRDDFFFYGAYASLFVLIPDDDPLGGRVMPPFQGNGGGPDGGPLFTLKGKGIDLFFHLTGLRPGTILQRGQLASFAGYSAPTLASKIEIVVTSPSGATRTIRGQANKIGYFYDPSQDFAVGESGVWKAKVKIVFDDRTSAGPVTAPFPTGDVLGSREGEFYFYVVDSNAAELELLPMPQFVRPADGAITFTIEPPAAWTNRQLTYTTIMPGFILEEGAKSSMTYTYDATKLAKDFPNLDLHDADGYAGVDTITISFLLSGTDASGARNHLARQVVIQGEELQMPSQAAAPRRRAVRK